MNRINFQDGALNRTRTCKVSHVNLNHARVPISPSGQCKAVFAVHKYITSNYQIQSKTEISDAKSKNYIWIVENRSTSQKGFHHGYAQAIGLF